MSSPREISPIHRAAVIIAHLPEENAAQIFKSLSRKEIRALTAASEEIRSLPPDQVQEILKEFTEQLQHGTPELRSMSEVMKKLAAKSMGTDKTRTILNDEDAGGLPDTLAELDSRTLATMLKKEYPQSIALILAHVEPRRAAEILSMLPEKLQPDILRRLASLDSVSPDVINLVEEAVINEIQLMGKGAAKRVGGINLVADIMNQLEKSREQMLMQKLDEEDPNLAENVRSLMFVFDDLVNLDNRAIQMLLKEVPRDTLLLSLKAADEDIKQRVFSNLSSRAVQMIVEDLDARGPVRLSEVEKAQAEVVRIALKLNAAGTIELSQSNDDKFV